ncbi:NACHT domain-containing protein [Actinoalloteichus hymeniacidonis]|uniref:NACHT domain n=1 Tax=Actinoalloteichus hymeniacidonis TaxID=340345 RepID=A0AAC9MYF4_9PSEU|nr:NACHT domain-containing protein [Actinoalloteichus hymeniacidonis]AOS62836.1 NACHT domain [Actinoalloteichus hymeniacidonis]MBB5909132.1 hypothetical protein [Actinoalloteichus hymeniacidonis]
MNDTLRKISGNFHDYAVSKKWEWYKREIAELLASDGGDQSKGERILEAYKDRIIAQGSQGAEVVAQVEEELYLLLRSRLKLNSAKKNDSLYQDVSWPIVEKDGPPAVIQNAESSGNSRIQMSARDFIVNEVARHDDQTRNEPNQQYAGRDINNFRIQSWFSGRNHLERQARKLRHRLIDRLLPVDIPRNIDLWLPEDREISYPFRANFRIVGSLSGTGPLSECREFKESVHRCFRESGGRILVTGEAGTGKTRVLAELTSKMLKDAQCANSNPIPFYMNITSWSRMKGGLVPWLAKELFDLYGVKDNVIRHWLDEGEIALILDGLDELNYRDRKDFVRSFNSFRRDYGTIPVVIACRELEHSQLRTRLDVAGRLSLTKMLWEDVESVLAQTQKHDGLLQRARYDSKLRDLLRTPLFMRFSMSAFLGLDPSEIHSKNRKWDYSIIQSYLDRAAERAGRKTARIDLGLHSWLPRIANQMRAERETVFFPDRVHYRFVSGIHARRIRFMSMCAVFVGALFFFLLCRMPLAIFTFNTQSGDIYFMMGIVGSTGVAFGCMILTRAVMTNPPGSIEQRTKGLMKKAFRRWFIGYMSISAIMAIMNQIGANSGVAYVVAILGNIVVAVWPVLVLIVGSAPGDPAVTPKYPNYELKSLLKVAGRCSLLVFSMVFGTLMMFLTPIYVARPEELPSNAVSTVFFFVPLFVITAFFINGGADLIGRLISRWYLGIIGFLPKPFGRGINSLRKSSVIVPSGGGYEFVHSLVRDHLATLVRS